MIVYPYRIAYCFNSAFRAITLTFSNYRMCVCADFVFGIISNVCFFFQRRRQAVCRTYIYIALSRLWFFNFFFFFMIC